MPWGVSFQSTITAFLTIGQSASKELTAQTIANAYHSDAQLVSPLLIPGSLPLLLPGPSGIAQGFLASFILAEALSAGEPPIDIWQPAAASIVAYWTGVQFIPMPPPPGGLLGTVNSVLAPGESSSLASSLHVAFKAGMPAPTKEAAASLVAAALNSAFVGHLTQVSGLWIGTAPGVPPIPFTFPWVGIV